MKLVDWDGRLVEKLQEGHLNNASHTLLYPGTLHATDRFHRAQRLHELTRCVQVDNIQDTKPIQGALNVLAGCTPLRCFRHVMPVPIQRLAEWQRGHGRAASTSEDRSAAGSLTSHVKGF